MKSLLQKLFICKTVCCLSLFRVSFRVKMLRRACFARRFTTTNRCFTTINRNASGVPHRYPQTIQWRNIRGVIGDLGDTIISGEPMVLALQGAFIDAFQLSVPSSVIYTGFGMPKHQQIREILSTHRGTVFERDVDVVHARFEQRLCDFYNKYGVQYLPGTEHGLATLHRHNIRFGATTGLSNRIIGYIESRLSMYPGAPSPIVHCERPSPEGIFKVLELWNRGIPPSQMIKLHQCIKIGDSMSDLKEAKTAGIPFIGISHHRSRSLRQEGTAESASIAFEFQLQGAVSTVGTIDDFVKLGIVACSDKNKRK